MAERNQMLITFNGIVYTATYNSQTNYYELELTAPEIGGIYTATIEFTDSYDDTYYDTVDIQVLAKEELKIEENKVFMWIFSYEDFSVRDIVELSDYEIIIDEETNTSSTIKVLKSTSAKARDIIAVKINNDVVYWGIIQEIQNDNGSNVYEYITKYITNLFNQDIILKNEDLISSTGVEDFIADAITNNFISNEDTFVNLSWLQVEINSHNTKQVSVSNVENNIYNLHTWITNCTQNYDIVYSFSISEGNLLMSIECKEEDTELIDTTAQAVSNYEEVFETDVVSKVTVLTSTDTYMLFLLSDRTTTTDMTDTNRAEGTSVVVYTEEYEDAEQVALDQMKANSYNHNITFDMYDKYMKVGTPIAIKTKESVVYNTYISAITINSNNKFYKYTCGNIRIDFIDKLLKERK